jgi:hypothetical protein
MPGLNEWLKVENDSCSFDFSDLKIWKKKECIDYAVEKITEKYENFYVALSGGIDSEFVANSLLERGINFIPVIVNLETNKIESWFAFKWCYENKKTPLVISLSEEEIVNYFPRISKTNNIPFYCSPQVLLSKIISGFDGSLLFGGEEFFQRDRFLAADMKPMSENLSTDNYSFIVEKINKKHPGGFLTYTPELIVNMVKEIDYSKPPELALAEYYGVMPRPKINAHMNLFLNRKIHELKIETDKDTIVSVYELGNKSVFLKYAEEKLILRVESQKLKLGS